MSLSDLASLGSFVSGAAVLVSLIFLYFQLRQIGEQVKQAEKNQQAAIQQARNHKRIDSLIARSGDDALSEAVRLSNEAPDEMTLMQYLKFHSAALAVFYLAEDTFYQRKQGLMSDIAYDAWLSSVRRGTLALPGIRAYWAIIRRIFSDEFVEFIDQLVVETSPVALKMQSSFEQWKAGAATEIERGRALRPALQPRPM